MTAVSSRADGDVAKARAADCSLTVVTGADEAYAGCLARLLANLHARGWVSRHRIVVFDLGLTSRTRERLERTHAWATFRTFDFGACPEHVALTRRTYAWKPLALAYVAEEGPGPVLWLDSACRVHGDAEAVEAALRREGVYALRGQTPLRRRCAPHVAAALGAEEPLLDMPEFAAGVIAFDPGREAIRRLLRTWRDWALEPAYAAPLSETHKPEQALLSLLLLRGIAAGEFRVECGEVDISSARPVRWVSTRLKVPPGEPGWLGALRQAAYGPVKTVDRWWHRWRRFKGTRIDGLHRWTKEHFQVWVSLACTRAADHEVRRAAERCVAVKAPRWTYYADPFLWREAGRLWLFGEAFRYPDHCGSLVALPLGETRAAGDTADVATPTDGTPRTLELLYTEHLPMLPVHRSYPFLFRHAGRTYLVPESTATRSVDLYVCEAFPDRWRWVRRLLEGVDAADTTLLEHDGRWWLFTSVRAEGEDGRALALFHADDPVTGRWTPHPVNAERRYAGAPFSTGRCAGPFVRATDGALLRPVHWSQRHYGEGVRLMRVETLNAEVYQEIEYTGGAAPSRLVAERSPHHVSADTGEASSAVAWDVRTRAGFARRSACVRVVPEATGSTQAAILPLSASSAASALSAPTDSATEITSIAAKRAVRAEGDCGLIVARLSHGLGNQLFQYAAAQELGWRCGGTVRFDVDGWFAGDGLRDPTPRPFLLERLGLEVPRADAEGREAPFARAWWGGRRPRPGWTHLTQRQAELPLEAFEAVGGPPVYLEGFWQGEVFFRNTRTTLARALLALQAKALLTKMAQAKARPGAEEGRLAEALCDPGCVALHVRRGDYVPDASGRPTRYRVLGERYYREALARMRSRVRVERALVFTDDPAWCVAHLELGVPFDVASRPAPADNACTELLCLASARRLIIANSTFSWWAAWIATQRGDAHVVMPERWYEDPAFDAWTRLLVVDGWETA